jgi:lysophospholipase L1-like esterase
MRRTTSVTLLWFLLALFFTACEKPPQLAPLPPGAVVLAFGDSLTHGNGAPDGAAYPDVLAGLLGRTVLNAGVPGEISAEGLRRLPRLLETHQPDLVILCHGGNDFLRRLDRRETAANLAAMVDQIRASGAGVVLVGIPEPGLFLDPPDFYREIAERAGIPYEERIVSDLLGDRQFKSDTIHPNAAGYRRMAEALFTLIRESHGL